MYFFKINAVIAQADRNYYVPPFFIECGSGGDLAAAAQAARMFEQLGVSGRDLGIKAERVNGPHLTEETR